MRVLELEDRVVRYTIATSAEMDTIPPWPLYNETRDNTGRLMTLLETRVADRVLRNEYGTDTSALGRRRALEWLDNNARALWEHPPLRGSIGFYEAQTAPWIDYARLLRFSLLNPSDAGARRALQDFEREHDVALLPHWQSWQEGRRG